MIVGWWGAGLGIRVPEKGRGIQDCLEALFSWRWFYNAVVNMDFLVTRHMHT